MHIVLGATGHIGSVLAKLLKERHEKVLVVTHDLSKKAGLEKQGYEVAVVDIHDVDELREVFREGQRAFLLNPPADPRTDTDKEEKKTVDAMLRALDGSGLHKVVAASTYGAQAVERAGDLGVLFGLEQGLRQQAIPFSILRSAYYLSNWDASLETVRKEGVLQTMFPADLKVPMVAPADIAHVAARLMTEPIQTTGLHHVTGPQDYSANDVAAAFSKALGQPVKVVEIPHEQWVATYKDLGFSTAAAESYARMIAMTVDEFMRGNTVKDAIHGTISLQKYVDELVGKDVAGQETASAVTG